MNKTTEQKLYDAIQSIAMEPDVGDYGEVLRISGLGKCVRERALLMDGMTPAPLSAEQRRRLETGHLKHAAMLQRLKREFPDALIEQTVNLSIETEVGCVDVPGHADVIVPSLKFIADLKTMGAYAFRKHRDGDVSEDYVKQILGYWKAWSGNGFGWRLFIIGEALDSDARYGIVGGDIHIEEIDLSDPENAATLQEASTEVAALHKAQQFGELQSVPHNLQPDGSKLPWRCNYCSVGPERGKCWDAEIVNKGDSRRPKWSFVR